jgi:ProP effector
VHAIGKLQKRFPAAFPKKPEPKLPLKVGIFEDLLPHAEQLGLSEAEIREAIATWCRGSRYWTCLTDGAARVDLNGAPAGVVNARDVAFARNSQRGGPRRPRAEGAAGAGGAAAATAKGEAAERPAAEGSEGEAHSNAAPAVEAPVLAQPDEASGAAVEAPLPGDATAAATAPEQLQNHAATGGEASASADVGASAESTAQAASTDAAEAPNPATPGAATAAASEKAHANP